MAHYKFDQIAFNITDKKMPEPGDEKMYVGLEHLDSGSLKVTRWGSEVELKGQKLVMRKGDILFGRRNTYLRRAAIAPYDGIFSAHGMIFRPKTDVIDPEYFPFFISSNYFMDAAIRISVGSLSPTVNWKTLKEIEFDIPTLEEQRKNAALLSTINETKEAYQELLFQTDNLVKSQFIEMFGDPATNSKNLPIATLQDLGTNLDNRRIPITGGDRKAGEYPYYGASGIVDYVADYIFDDDLLLISEDGANLVARVTPIAFPSTGKVWINNHAHVIKFNSMAMQCYVENLLNMMDISLYVTGTAQPKLNQAKLNSIPIPVPEEDQIREYLEFVKQSDKSKFELKEAIQSCDALMKAILFTNLEEKED